MLCGAAIVLIGIIGFVAGFRWRWKRKAEIVPFPQKYWPGGTWERK